MGFKQTFNLNPLTFDGKNDKLQTGERYITIKSLFVIDRIFQPFSFDLASNVVITAQNK